MVFTGELGNEDHVGFPLLEEVDDVEAGCLWAGFWKSGEGELADLFAVFWVVGNQDLDEEHADKVVFVTWFVNWDAGVTGGQDVVHGFLVKNGVGGHGKYVLHWSHDVSNWLVLEIEHGRDDCNFVLVEAIRWTRAEGLMKSDEGFETGFLVDGAVVLAEEVIEQLCSWPCDRRKEIHENQDIWCHKGSNLKSIADANGLRNDLSEDD